MAPLEVDPVALDGAGAEVVTAAEGLASVISTLIAALSGCAGMAGDDPAGAALGHSYDGSASQLIEAMATTRNGLCGLGIGVRMSAQLLAGRGDVEHWRQRQPAAGAALAGTDIGGLSTVVGGKQ